MNRMQRTPFLSVVTFAVAGLAIGLLVQLVRSAQGSPPLVPPLSLAATLLVIAAVLVVLAILLRRAVLRTSGRAVNPFHAVRLLAGARAGQFAGALFAGLAAGSGLQLLTRSILPPASTWAPMLLVLTSGVVLVVCGVIAELLCRVPPGDSEENPENHQGDVIEDGGFAP
ncbi:hypothetical protein LEUCIP111803_02373 [Leucobacter soli]|uniref:DUF3180 domain-containing protein n=3 Tax=Leucobacter soli TaxID=2812850 RepID=A0A916K040_9MICO|nr:hypothetical protein LEUCIP111803_02373 [Leucobacter soli]